MRFLFSIGLMIILDTRLNSQAGEPARSSTKTVSLQVECIFTIQPDQPKQLIKGIGLEIQRDSIGSANHGLEIGTLSGKMLSPTLQPLSWEFWEQQ